MALPPSTANWHWKNKNVTRWAKEWFEQELPSVSIKGDKEGEVVNVASVTEVDGDVELGQRKSKLITVYDCKVELKWTGIASDGTEVNGTLVIPEVSHEITLDHLSDYAYSWKLETKASPEVNALYALAKSRLPAALEAKFAQFPLDIIDTHGKDLIISADPSRSGTPAPSTGPIAPKAASTATALPAVTKKAEAAAKPINTTTISVEASFQASASDLFQLLTDEKKIPSWTRAPAQSTPQPGSGYSLFGGGVKGEFVSLTADKEIVQTWALQSPTWPTGHVARLTTTLEQSDNSTKLKLSLANVPTGIEEEIKRNLEGYYIHGFKSIGLGSEL